MNSSVDASLLGWLGSGLENATIEVKMKAKVEKWLGDRTPDDGEPDEILETDYDEPGVADSEKEPALLSDEQMADYLFTLGVSQEVVASLKEQGVRMYGFDNGRAKLYRNGDS